MSPASALLDELHAAGARLTVRDDRLVVDAPRGRLTEEHRHRLATHRDELVALLAEPPEPDNIITLRVTVLPESLVAWARQRGIGLTVVTLEDGAQAVAVNGPADERFRRAVRECGFLVDYLAELDAERPA